MDSHWHDWRQFRQLFVVALFCRGAMAVLIHMARCSAETLSGGDAVLDCPVPSGATHGIVRATGQSTETGT